MPSFYKSLLVALAPDVCARGCQQQFIQVSFQTEAFGYPHADRIPIGANYLARPEQFVGPLDATGNGCDHEPRHDFTIPHELDHHAGGYSGTGVWCWHSTAIWSPVPRLVWIIAGECTLHEIVSEFRIETTVCFFPGQQRPAWSVRPGRAGRRPRDRRHHHDDNSAGNIDAVSSEQMALVA